MSRRQRLVLQVVVAAACLWLPDVIARQVGLARAAGLLSLANLAALVISVRLGWRQALWGSLALALLSVPAVLSQGDLLAATGLLTLTACALGVTIRWQLQPVYWLLMVSLCMLVVDLPLPDAGPVELTKLTVLLMLSCSLTARVQSWLMPRSATTSEAPLTVQHSWRRSLGYGLLLGTTTLITTPIAMQQHWHTTGLWLILTPILVIRPFVKDGWRVALNRCLGSIAGVLLVHLLALVLPPALPLQVPAIALGATAALIGAKHGPPVLFVVLLTATIVLFNSSDSSLLFMADRRLEANLIGIGVALGVLALAHPSEHLLTRHRAANGS